MWSPLGGGAPGSFAGCSQARFDARSGIPVPHRCYGWFRTLTADSSSLRLTVGKGWLVLFVGTITFDVVLGDVRSLKEKRGIVRPVIADVRRKFEVAVAEVGHQDLHRRSEIGVAVIGDDLRHCGEILDAVEQLVAGRPELELLSTRRRFHSDED